MKFIVRFLLPLSLLLGTLIYLSAPVIDQLMTRWFTRDLDIRARLIANVLEETLAVLLVDGSPSNRQKITKILTKVTQDERLLAIAICDQSNTFLYKTDLFPSNLQCPPKSLGGVRKGEIHRLPTGDVHMAAISVVVDPPQSSDSPPSGEPKHYDVALVHDLSYAAKRSDDTKTYAYLLFLGLGLMISGLTVIVARWSRASWVKSVRQLVGGFRGDMSSNQGLKGNRDFLPILRDLKGLVRDLEATSRSNADYGNTWNPTALRSILKEKLSGDEIIVISNRQPYIHNKIDDKIVIQSPASGLVTALEPIMKACSGVWIAHGNGSADAEVVDSDSRIPVPPRKPQYDLHRLWLTAEEERGYYYGFSNEGIWPLCHIAHTRPVFRHSDWQQYVAVNKKFAQAVIKDSKSDDPVILVQDYHFALVPRLLREKLPKATIITFWHIPWPNPESFGICPWRQEILQGLLGSSIVGFQTQFHCNNFIESCDRYLESRVDRETDAISYRGETTEIRPYPISIEWPPERLADTPDAQTCRKKIQTKHRLDESIKIGIGIDRLDYTKGLIERFRSVERLLELFPKWIGKFTFIQIAAPTRSTITSYKRFAEDLRSVAEEINARFGRPGYTPIILLESHHEPRDVFIHMRAADICMVSSLHDGMNLVAKEFVACRENETGVLILSMFAGASRELAEALIVNPYDADICAYALETALQMPESEQRERMRNLRTIVKEYNVYRWAGRMLMDASRMRQRNRFNTKIGDFNSAPTQGFDSQRVQLARTLNNIETFTAKGLIKL